MIKSSKMGKMKYYTQEELKDADLGKVGTPSRDAYEAELRQELQAYHIGEAIRQARKDKHLTQDQLGELMGVKRAEVCRIEKGRNLTIGTIAKAFRVMGIPARLEFGNRSFLL